MNYIIIYLISICLSYGLDILNSMKLIIKMKNDGIKLNVEELKSENNLDNYNLLSNNFIIKFIPIINIILPLYNAIRLNNEDEYKKIISEIPYKRLSEEEISDLKDTNSYSKIIATTTGIKIYIVKIYYNGEFFYYAYTNNNGLNILYESDNLKENKNDLENIMTSKEKIVIYEDYVMKNYDLKKLEYLIQSIINLDMLEEEYNNSDKEIKKLNKHIR